MNLTVFAMLMTLAVVMSASAQERVPAQPLFDTPLRDPAVCRGPNGTFYLTGTVASDRSGSIDQADPLDFMNNSGVFLWRSADMTTWEPLGKVWDLHGGQDRGNAMRWTQYLRLNPDDPDGPWVRGVQSPEVHFVKDAVYIVFAMSGGGTGLLKSKSGKPEGPYQMHARLTTSGDTPSLFEDAGTCYWLWDGGWIAKLNDDLTALAEEPRFLRPASESKLNDFPVQVGSRGAFLFKHAGRYHLVGTDITSRLGAACRDTFVAEADNVYGPYGPRRMMVPHGGQVTLFTDAGGKPFSTFGGDPQAVFMDRPGIVPLVDDGFLKHLCLMRPTVTEGGPISKVQPIALPGDYGGIRDPQILLAPDGNYYLTGTSGKKGLRVPGCRLWKSADLKTWEALGDEHGVIWYVDETEWCSKPFKSKAVAQPVHDFWAPQIHYVKDNYYIPFCMFGGGIGMLRSASGKPEGPYEDCAGRLHTWGGDPCLFEDDDPPSSRGASARDSGVAGGTVYMHIGFGPTQMAKMKDDMSGFDGKLFHIGPADGSILGHEGGYLEKMEGKYVFFYTTLNGEEEAVRKSRARYHRIGTYDFMYCWADSVRGPYTRGRIAVPHGGHGAVFKDKNGRWMATMFGTDRTGPFRSKLGVFPLRVEWTGEDLVVEPEQ